jgi:hypothetical protein
MNAATLTAPDPATIKRTITNINYYTETRTTLTGAARDAFNTAVDQAYTARRQPVTATQSARETRRWTGRVTLTHLTARDCTKGGAR